MSAKLARNGKAAIGGIVDNGQKKQPVSFAKIGHCKDDIFDSKQQHSNCQPVNALVGLGSIDLRTWVKVTAAFLIARIFLGFLDIDDWKTSKEFSLGKPVGKGWRISICSSTQSKLDKTNRKQKHKAKKKRKRAKRREGFEQYHQMEGLIPMVYKVLKKNRTRRQYECLSSGVAQTYNVSDFCMIGDKDACARRPSSTDQRQYVGNYVDRKAPHRRFRSVEDFSALDHRRDVASSPPQKQLVRFRSHRMFTCVTGA